MGGPPPINYYRGESNAGWASGDEVRMIEGFLRTLIKVAVASLIVGTILAHFGITPDELMKGFGLSSDRIIEMGRRSVAWALPNLMLGALVIIPIWFLAFLFRPPGPSSSD
jgi:Family of unknown function (DUF6460)